MYAFMDIEATGQTPSEAFQVSMIITDKTFQVKEILNLYVEHDYEITPYVLDLCQLTNEDIGEIEKACYLRSETVEIIERIFEKYIDEEMIFVGKMIKGDIKWLRKIGACCSNIKFMEDSKYIEMNCFMETNHKLEEDCLKYGFDQGLLVKEVEGYLKSNLFTYGMPKLLGKGYHNALVDAYAVYKIFQRISDEEAIDIEEYVQAYDWTNRSYLMMNRKAMEDKIAVKIYQNALLSEIREEYGIDVSYKKLMLVDSIAFENGCVMGVTKKDILVYLYGNQLKKSCKSCFSRYEVRVRRKKNIRRLNIVALNRFDLFVQLSKILSPQHVPKNFEKRVIMIGLLNNPCAYLIVNGYTLLGIKEKESQIDFRKVG